jgi:hypothetical protein
MPQVYRWGSAAMYEGEVQGGLRHGAGLLRFADNPVVYEGQWQAGKRHGQGVLVYNAEQTAFYEGGWECGCRDDVSGQPAFEACSTDSTLRVQTHTRRRVGG